MEKPEIKHRYYISHDLVEELLTDTIKSSEVQSSNKSEAVSISSNIVTCDSERGRHDLSILYKEWG